MTVSSPQLDDIFPREDAGEFDQGGSPGRLLAPFWGQRPSGRATIFGQRAIVQVDLPDKLEISSDASDEQMTEEWSTWVPILRVKDARTSARFYIEAMGFEIDWEHRFADDFPLYIQVSRPPLRLHLSEHQGGGTRAAELFVRVPDVDAVYMAMLERGIQPDSELTTQQYGIRDFSVVDPDGHRVTLGTPAGFPTELHRKPEDAS